MNAQNIYDTANLFVRRDGKDKSIHDLALMVADNRTGDANRKFYRAVASAIREKY